MIEVATRCREIDRETHSLKKKKMTDNVLLNNYLFISQPNCIKISIPGMQAGSATRQGVRLHGCGLVWSGLTEPRPLKYDNRTHKCPSCLPGSLSLGASSSSALLLVYLPTCSANCSRCMAWVDWWRLLLLSRRPLNYVTIHMQLPLWGWGRPLRLSHLYHWLTVSQCSSVSQMHPKRFVSWHKWIAQYKTITKRATVVQLNQFELFIN